MPHRLPLGRFNERPQPPPPDDDPLEGVDIRDLRVPTHPSDTKAINNAIKLLTAVQTYGYGMVRNDIERTTGIDIGETIYRLDRVLKGQ